MDDTTTLTTLKVGGEAATAETLIDAITSLIRRGPLQFSNVPVKFDGALIESVQFVRDNTTGDHFINLTTGE